MLIAAFTGFLLQFTGSYVPVFVLAGSAYLAALAMLQGKARIVNRKEFREFRKKIYAKYSQYQTSAPLGERDSVIVEVTPERKFSWGIE